MKTYGSGDTSLTLTPLAHRMYLESDPITIYERLNYREDSLTYRIEGIIETDWIEEDEVNDILESLYNPTLFVAIRDTGDLLEEVSSFEEGIEVIKSFEEEDKANGCYEENSYDIEDEECYTLVEYHGKVMRLQDLT